MKLHLKPPPHLWMQVALVFLLFASIPVAAAFMEEFGVISLSSHHEEIGQ